MNSKFNLNLFKNITENESSIKKKIIQFGFGSSHPKDLDEVTINYICYLLDGRTLDNTYITKEPQIVILGKNNLVPGLELAMKNMLMGELSQIYIEPQLSFLLQDQIKNNTNENILQIINSKSQDELNLMEINELRKYVPIIYEIEIVKFDKPRKTKSAMDPEERIEEACQLKNEGNELFKEKRYQEAIVKFNSGLHYLTQMPTDFLSSKVINLRITFNLNIANCHIFLCEYNYALKKLEEILLMTKNNPPNMKFYYYRCIALMNLGEFKKAGVDYKYLKNLLPNDPLIKKLEDDFEKIKEITFVNKKDLIRKGMFSHSLYDDIIIKVEDNRLPKFDFNNLKFYIDLLVNNNLKDPQKIKFEIFKEIEKLKLKEILLDDLINNKKIISNDLEISCDNKYNGKNINLLSEYYINNEEITNVFLNSKLNYPPCEDYLLILIKNKENSVKIAITLEKLSENRLNDIIVLGRCFYNDKVLKTFYNDEKICIKITDCDYLK